MNEHNMISRRHILKAGTIAMLLPRALSAGESPSQSLIQSISRDTLWDNLDGKGVTWFQTRCCMIPDSNGKRTALMTMQEIAGSDYYGGVHEVYSDDRGKSWTEPDPVAAFGQYPMPEHEGLRRAVCDVVPEYHPETNSVLAIGLVVFYRGERFSKADQLARYPMYAVRDSNGQWSQARKLEWDDPRGSNIYANNCGQRVTLPNGDVLLAFTFGDKPIHRSVASVRCTFDGNSLKIKEVGPALELKHKRGLLEPSLTWYGGRFYMTIRAEDDHGYVAASEDGLNWSDKQQWTWDDGSPIGMSTTQQHWLTHSEGLFLVYNRRDDANRNVIRWRSPLFVAEVDPKRMVLKRETERVVVPMQGDGVNKPNEVPLMGNFHIVNATESESWLTVGSWRPRMNESGAVTLARIQWAQPNTLVRQSLDKPYVQ